MTDNALPYLPIAKNRKLPLAPSPVAVKVATAAGGPSLRVWRQNAVAGNGKYSAPKEGTSISVLTAKAPSEETRDLAENANGDRAHGKSVQPDEDAETVMWFLESRGRCVRCRQRPNMLSEPAIADF